MEFDYGQFFRHGHGPSSFSHNRSRVAKFESKVDSHKGTKIGNLVILDIFLVALMISDLF